MPLSTFQNLPDRRKEEILTVCFEEFTAHNYETASVSRIIRNLGLAKGSFYRYFQSKYDLYFYLIEYAMNLRMENVTELFESPDKDFFTLFEEHITSLIRFCLRYPLHSGFLSNIIQERNSYHLGNQPARTKEMLLETHNPVMEYYQRKGIIRKDADADILAYTIAQIQLGIFDFLEIRFGSDPGKNIQNKQSSIPIKDEDIRHIAKVFSEVLKTGLEYN